MTDHVQTRQRWRRLEPFVVLALLAIAGFTEETTATWTNLVHYLAIVGAFSLMISKAALKTELERLIFFRSTVIGFCVVLAVAIGSGAARDIAGVTPVSLEDLAIVGIVAWLFARIVLAQRMR
jgi:hypothetical protein